MTQPSSRRSKPKGNSLIRTLVIVAVVASGAGVLAVAVNFGGDGGGELTADLARVSRQSFEITTVANGELEAKNQIELRNKVESSTSIVELIDEGVQVKAGDVLVVLNSDQIETRIDEEELRVVDAQNQLESSQAAELITISENKSKLLAAETKLTLAGLDYAQWVNGDDKKKQGQLALAVSNAGDNLERLERKFGKLEELKALKFVSYDEWATTKIQLNEAKGRMSTAELELMAYTKYQREKDMTQKQLNVTEAVAGLERVEQENDINLRRRVSDVSSRQRQLVLRQKRLSELQEQLDFCEVIAPSDGLVVYGSSVQSSNYRNQSEGGLQVGRDVRSNDLLIVLPDISEMIASVKVHESLAGRVHPGQRAQVKIEARGVTVPGTVLSIGVLAESGGWRDPNRREYTVKIALDTESTSMLDLKPTIRCEARIELDRVVDTLAVPLPAVFNEGAVRFVYTPTGSKFIRVPVAVGRINDTHAEITAGLDAGKAVLLREPSPGEVLSGEWDAEQLALTGYTIGEDGRPRRAITRRMMPAGMTRPAGPGATQPGAGKPSVGTDGASRRGSRQGSRPGGSTGSTGSTGSGQHSRPSGDKASGG